MADVPLPPTHYVIGIEGDGYSEDRLTMMPAWDDDAVRARAAAVSAADNAALREIISTHARIALEQDARVKVLEGALHLIIAAGSDDTYAAGIARAALEKP